MKISVKNILIFLLVGVVVCFGLKIYYEWKQYKDMTIGEIIVDIFDKTEDKIISDEFGDNIFSVLQNTDENFANDKIKSAEFMEKYNVMLNDDEKYLYNMYYTQKLKAERIRQSLMGAGQSKSWILYGDGTLYYVGEVVNGMWDMGPLSAIVASRYMADNADMEESAREKVYRIKKYKNGWETFWGIGIWYNSSYFDQI